MKTGRTALACLVLIASGVAAQATKTPPPAATKAPPPNTKTAAPAQAAPGMPVIMREVFAYEQAGRRDPFISLLQSDELRPTIGDLRLTGILYDEAGRTSIATMRDVNTKEFYRVQAGTVLGRMRVALIKRRSVIFSIEEFGENRQDSLVLGDTTKVRAP